MTHQKNYKKGARGMKHARNHWLFVLVSTLLLCGCEESGEISFEPFDLTPYAAPSLTVESRSGCVLDMDCEGGLFCFQGQCARQCSEDSGCGKNQLCSARGRCMLGVKSDRLDAGDEPAVPEILAGIKLTDLPARIQRVAGGQETLTVFVGTSAPVPAEGVAYRVDHLNGEGGLATVLVAPPAASGIGMEITVDAAGADPNSETPWLVELQVVSAVGSFRLSLVPEPPFAGTYAGTVSFPLFGQQGLPIDFQVVTKPEDASLASAKEAWLVLSLAPENLFAPWIDGVQWDTAASKLEYSDLLDRWVAVFEGGFNMGPNSFLPPLPVGQVKRTMRFEIEPAEGQRLVGDMDDTWEGLYQKRTSDGAKEIAKVTFSGALALTRVGGAPSADEVTPGPSSPPANPSLLAPPDLGLCGDDAGLFNGVGVYLAEDETEHDCGEIDDLMSFQKSTPDARASCAIAYARMALEGDSTAAQIAAFLDEDTENPGGDSFAEFMEDCAVGANGRCDPPPRGLLCPRPRCILIRLVHGTPGRRGRACAHLRRPDPGGVPRSTARRAPVRHLHSPEVAGDLGLAGHRDPGGQGPQRVPAG